VKSIIRINSSKNQMNISSRQLDAFIALAQLGSFTLAAQRCHLSQPAFSALIKGLEEGVGVRLFDRSTRHVALTQEGAQFLDAAQRIRTDLGDAVQGLREAAALQRGRVSIALLPSLAAAWLPPVLALFHARHPGIQLQVSDLLAESCIAHTEELQAEWFCADRLHLVCRADHALAALPSPRMADLKDQPFIQLARHSSVRQYLESQSRAQPLDTLLEVEHLATVMGMVRAGLGISVVPALALFHFVQPGLVTRPLADADRQRDLYLVRRRQRSLSPAAQAFHTLALEHRPGTDEAA
jgi:DNA-binding transcriptional LysR family regulator